MSTVTLTQPTSIDLDSLKRRGPVPFIDPNKSYTFVIQLGANRCWGKYSGGAWQRDPEKDNPGKSRAYIHEPAIHRIPSTSGVIVNGLIQAGNDWLEANIDRVLPKGMIVRQLAIFDIAETEGAPADEPALRITESSLAKVAEGAVRAALSVITGKSQESDQQ